MHNIFTVIYKRYKSILLISILFGVISCGGGGIGNNAITSPSNNSSLKAAALPSFESDSQSITFFALDNNTGIIIGTKILVEVPYATNLTELIAIFSTTGKFVTVNGEVQLSGHTPNDFTGPVTYTVHAADGSTRDYTVIVTVAPDPAKDIYQFALNGYTGVISGTNISVEVPYGTAVTQMIAIFGTTGQSVTVNGIFQISGLTPNDFTNPVTYTVHAADGSTRNYTVTVTVAGNTAKDIYQFALNGFTGIISGDNISVEVSYGTDVTQMIAIFATTGQSVTVRGVLQVSGQTSNDFTGPVTYTVHAADGTIRNYTVTVTVAPDPAAIYQFALNGYTGVISGTNISVEVPYATDVTQMIAIFATTGQSVTVRGVLQVSGQTSNDFTSPVTYTVHAADGTIQNYTVTVTVALDPAKDIYQFALNGFTAIITGTNILVGVPYGTDITQMIAIFATTGQNVTVRGVLQVSGQTSNDFTSPVTYTVHAADGSTKDYKVNVIINPHHAYIVNALSVIKCDVDDTNGLFSNCVNSGVSQVGGGSAIAFYQDLAFIANNGVSNAITKCNYGVTGNLINCANSGVNNIANASSIFINNAFPDYAYISNMTSNSVVKCKITNNNLLSSACADSGATGLNFPYGIYSNTKYAYIANSGSNTVTRCMVNSNGSLNGCGNSGANTLNGPKGLVLDEAGKYAFIANFVSGVNTLTRCTVNSSNGNLSGCTTNTGAGLLSQPYGVAFNKAGTYLYITNPGNQSVVKCKFNAGNGNLSECVNLNISSLLMLQPSGITFY